MLASSAPDLHDDMITDLPHAAVNATLRCAIGFDRFVSAVIADNRHASQHGLTVIDAYSSPNGREGDCSAKIKTFPTTATRADYAPLIGRIRTLAVLAGRVTKLASCDDDMPVIDRAARATFAQMSMIDGDLWRAFVASEKAHLDGPAAAILDTDGFAWTASRKGHATTIRNDASATNYVKSHKSSHYYLDGGASLSERDMPMSDGPLY